MYMRKKEQLDELIRKISKLTSKQLREDIEHLREKLNPFNQEIEEMLNEKNDFEYIISTDRAISKRLLFIRNCYGLNQSQIAQYLNIDRSTYAYYETGKTIPDIFTITKLCHLYNISILYFILKDNSIFIESLMSLL